jgi:hypothetical protein
MDNTLPKLIVVRIDGLNDLVHSLETTIEFPTIDTDALLSIVFEIFIISRYARIDNVFLNLIHSDLICSNLRDLENTTTVKLEAIIYKLLMEVRSALIQLKTRDVFMMQYRYKQRKRNNCVLLEKSEPVFTTRNTGH